MGGKLDPDVIAMPAKLSNALDIAENSCKLAVSRCKGGENLPI